MMNEATGSNESNFSDYSQSVSTWIYQLTSTGGSTQYIFTYNSAMPPLSSTLDEDAANSGLARATGVFAGGITWVLVGSG